MGAERRVATRYATSIPVGIRFSTGSVKEGWGRILNLSSTGLFLETRFPVKAAGILYVSFNLTDGARFSNLRVRVIRSRYEEGYYFVGIAFDDVVDKETLRDVISALAYEGGLTPL